MKPKKTQLLVLTVLAITACTTVKPRVATPSLASAMQKTTDITETLSLVRNDGKEIRSLQRSALSNLERLDYKTTLLLRQR